ncbi:PREDICTED: aprataxin and PNK-like factor isoform X2 [Condylura cristata]|uniref:aprataxin and PNK-like factor isoform X2 n=1 Tax=Condylura cristata TaxID=143302 RepID=UPI0006430A0D|nr:PREDICTED: aprataxin and PNK-like factor isoform X2 [Condylura cristata]
MSGGFALQSQDGGPRVALAPGETVIGRGPLLGIHTNPCFYQSSEKSQLLPLKTNLWHWLNPGDRFSLLANKYIFCVFSTHSETQMECTLRNSQMLDEDVILNEIPTSSLMNLPDETVSAPQWERSPEIAEAQTAMANSVSFLGECTNFSKQQPNPGQRKRILPAWMLTENLSDQNLPASVISEGNNIIQESGKRGICKNKTQGNLAQQRRKLFISSESSEGTSAEQDTGQQCRDVDQEESVISSKEIPQSFSSSTLSYTQMNNTVSDTRRNKIPKEELGKVSEHKFITKGRQDEEDEAVNCFESCLSAQSKSLHESQGSHPKSSSNPSNPETLYAQRTDSVPQSSEENKVKRTSCMYGANCYRKNPIHFEHFSHPGDSDYGSVQATCQDEADDRPECPYGASCYRKNPQHKIEYRHSTLPVGSISDEDSDNVGPSNEYDLNDNFLDDEEEDYEPTDEDSDWEPGKEDQEKEDVEELLKEAKRFMKRKK